MTTCVDKIGNSCAIAVWLPLLEALWFGMSLQRDAISTGCASRTTTRGTVSVRFLVRGPRLEEAHRSGLGPRTDPKPSSDSAICDQCLCDRGGEQYRIAKSIDCRSKHRRGVEWRPFSTHYCIHAEALQVGPHHARRRLPPHSLAPIMPGADSCESHHTVSARS